MKKTVEKSKRHSFVFVTWLSVEDKQALYKCTICNQHVSSCQLYKLLYYQPCSMKQ